MYRAKEAGGGALRALRRPTCAAALERLRIETALAAALERERTRACTTSPMVDLTTGAITAFEALVRWEHPDHGLVAAGRVHRARRGDRADRADRRVGARRGVPAGAALAAAGSTPDLKVRSTSRPASCAHPLTLGAPTSAICATGLSTPPPVPRGDRERADRGPTPSTTTLAALKALGRQDRGRRLRHGLLVARLPRALPVDTLKIDRSFVPGSPRSPRTRHRRRAVIELGQALGIRVVAEGVETPSSSATSRARCDTPRASCSPGRCR